MRKKTIKLRTNSRSKIGKKLFYESTKSQAFVNKSSKKSQYFKYETP